MVDVGESESWRDTEEGLKQSRGVNELSTTNRQVLAHDKKLSGYD